MNTDFDDAFRVKFRSLLSLRRDVRKFLPKPIDEDLLQELLLCATKAPSVGLSEPWQYVRVKSLDRRVAIRAEFELANAEALSGYHGSKAKSYSALKLAGLDVAPEQFAVYADSDTSQGHGLGRQTMPETIEYSVVGSIMNLWLGARAHGVGLGWVSILRPGQINMILDVPASWKLVAYLCLGYPTDAVNEVPELERAGWEHRRPTTWHSR
jgi:5,6-dimethylbenzimidazole synthase